MAKKITIEQKACTLSHDEFMADNVTYPQQLKLQVLGTDGNPLLDLDGNPTVITADKRDFSTGSWGYYATDKLPIGGQRLQVGLNMIMVGSKERFQVDAGKAVEPQDKAEQG